MIPNLTLSQTRNSSPNIEPNLLCLHFIPGLESCRKEKSSLDRLENLVGCVKDPSVVFSLEKFCSHVKKMRLVEELVADVPKKCLTCRFL